MCANTLPLPFLAHDMSGCPCHPVCWRVDWLSILFLCCGPRREPHCICQGNHGCRLSVQSRWRGIRVRSSFRSFIFSVAHGSIAGNTPANKESVATLHPRMIAPTSSHFYKHFVAKMAHRILFCLLLSPSHPLLAQMVRPCQMSPDLRRFSTILVRSLPPFYFTHLCLMTSRRGHELRYMGFLEFLRRT